VGTLNGFRILAALLHGTLVVGVSQTGALNRGRYLYSAGWPSRWALAHILVLIFSWLMKSTFIVSVYAVQLLYTEVRWLQCVPSVWHSVISPWHSAEQTNGLGN